MKANNEENYFFDTIKNLRAKEEILLYTRLMEVSSEEENLVTQFLEKEYLNECIDYPFTAPAYDAKAALWSAKTVYLSGQLLLYREHRETDIKDLLPAYNSKITPSAILSADLCLRFLPDLISNAKMIDAEDILAIILETHLQEFHYSAISIDLTLENLNFDVIISNSCLKQLYVNRVIEKKVSSLANLPLLNQYVKESMGDFSNYFWKELN